MTLLFSRFYSGLVFRSHYVELQYGGYPPTPYAPYPAYPSSYLDSYRPALPLAPPYYGAPLDLLECMRCGLRGHRERDCHAPSPTGMLVAFDLKFVLFHKNFLLLVYFRLDF
jgi:hypothetical protein